MSRHSRSRVLPLLAGVAVLMAPSVGAAQSIPSACGPVQKNHVARQYPSIPPEPLYEMWVETIRDPVTICPAEVQSEGWVAGFGGAGVKRAVFNARMYKVEAVTPGNRSSYGRHWFIFAFGWFDQGMTARNAHISVPMHTPQQQCAAVGGTWNYELGICEVANSPIIVDVSNDGYRLTNARQGVPFDIDADGTPDQVAWTHPNGDEAFLVFDRNGNGRVDDGAELFGDATPMYASAAEPRAANGFDALLALERTEFGGGVPDGIIDRHDAVFRDLYLWHDANHDGRSQPRELTRVAHTDIVGFGTTAKEKKRVDEHGNEFRLKGVIYVKPRDGQIKTQDVWDIWLRRES